jgi:hypothetical protein
MDTERLKITAETAAIRGRGWLRLAVRLTGIAIVVIGAANLFGVEVWTAYRSVWPAVVEPSDGQLLYAADFVVAVVGGAIANFV